MELYKDLNEKQKWILKWINDCEISSVDIYNQQFIDDYIKQFKPKYVVQPFGANHVPEVGRLLSSMYKKYYLLRSKIGLKNMEVGYAKWVYSYYVEK